MPLRICTISAEFTPFAKTGGLGDVVAALSKDLHHRGADVRVFLPFYSTIRLEGIEHHAVDFLQDVPVEFGPHSYRISVLTIRVPRSPLWIYLVDCPAAFDRARIYTNDPDEHLRFLLLTRAAFECCQRMDFAPDIVHCHDWHTAFAPLLLRAAYGWNQRLFAATRSVLTVHNIGYQGSFGAHQAGDVGIDPSALHQADLYAGRVNPLRHGVIHADAITAVSPTFAREIRTPEGGFGLDGDLRARGESVVGILNGVDYEEWDPGVDRHIPHRYGPDSLADKRRNKRRLLEVLGIPADDATPLFGMVTRLTVQKGIDLLPAVLPDALAARDLRLVALGSGEPHYEAFLRRLQARFPEKVVFHCGYNEQLAHWIEAASDYFLMPSLYEPCGLNQMYSLRYGTVPIVRRTGGLADSVQHFDPQTGAGDGIVFEHYDANALRWALGTALDWYGRPGLWERIARNGMAADFSWERQGAEYVALYERLAASP
jgi:starch synthase